MVSEHRWRMGGLESEKTKVLWRDKCRVGEAKKTQTLTTKPEQSNDSHWSEILAGISVAVTNNL